MRKYGLSLLAVLASLLAGGRMAVAEPVKVREDMTGPWQLFIDDYLVASKQNVVRRYHRFEKYKHMPLISVDKPWEANVVAACTVLGGEDGTGFRMWYYCWTPEGDPERSYLCYATSKDGVTWEKPNLGLYEWKGKGPGSGTKNNNILPEPGVGHVMRTPWESDPGKRYHGVGGMYYARVSPDGIHWTNVSNERIVGGGDTSHFYWDPHTKQYRCNVKVGAEVSGMRRRCVGFSESKDLTHFDPLQIIMAPDDLDDAWCLPNTVQRTHFYACPVTPYESMYVGFLQIYRAQEPDGYFHGPLWLELASSRDGRHWLREEPDLSVKSPTELYVTSRRPLLDLGKFREFDDGMVIAPAAIMVGDEIWLYYTGYDELHDLLPYHSAIGLAKLRKDGFVSLDADEPRGEIVTKRFTNTGGVMQVNYDARGGSVRVELLDEAGNVLPGYASGDCEPLTGNAIRKAVAWKQQKELPADGKPLRFRFVLDHARLYSFMPGEKVAVLDEPAKPCLAALYTFEGDTEAWSDMLGEDGLQKLVNLGTSTLDHKKPEPAFGHRSLVVGSDFRPWNRVEIEGTRDLGRYFTLAAMVKVTKNSQARLFSAYRGNYPVNTSELIFDFDPRGRVLNGLRLFCKGISIESDAVTFEDNKYHHLAVVYDDGAVTFYLDGKAVGQSALPGGEPVKLARNLLIGEDAEMGSDEQLRGNVDDVLVLGRALGAADIEALAKNGATAFFAKK